MRNPFPFPLRRTIVLPLVAGTALLAGCSLDPASYETAPVTLQSAKGPVVCQLYSKEIVEWDRSIDRPARMSVKEADDICYAEGLRQKRGG